jgi:hypothetical protein
MKRIASVVVFFILLFVFSKWGPAINFNTTSQSKGDPMVVSAEGTVAVAPDIAKVSVGIEASGQSLKQVQDEVNKKSQALVVQIKKLGVAEKDIKTTSYNVYPQNDYGANPPKITGYRVSTNYQISVKDFDKINDLMVIATNNGANVISGVSFEISDDLKEEKLNEARAEASDKAKAKAQGLAKAANITLGKIINITESEEVDFPRPYLTDKAIPNAGGGAPVAEPDIQPGQTDLTITVSLSFEVR